MHKHWLYIKDPHNLNKRLLLSFIIELKKILHITKIPYIVIDTDYIYVKISEPQFKGERNRLYFIGTPYKDVDDDIYNLLQQYHNYWPNKSSMCLDFTK